MYNATLIAYAFVKKGIEEGNPLTQMKLQKVVYFAQGLSLSLKDKDLVRENFQAWKYGPVIPVIYHDYKYYGSSPIQDTEWLQLAGYYDLESSFNLDDLDSDAKSIIEETWNILRDIPGAQLSNWTHKDDSPWSKYYKPGVPDIIIPKEDIKEYFTRFKKSEDA